MIDDVFVKDPAHVRKVLFCSGKVYFDLADYQQKGNHQDTAIIRLEQIYPLPFNQLEELYNKYNKATWFWVQEEPLNMGAASFLQMNLSANMALLALNMGMPWHPRIRWYYGRRSSVTS